ncbi:hypothetical protein ABC195_09450 [Microbacterium sp. 2P01SA-2]|uniref:hypothetical protein n=1 Tax=unclassified Microbacterium TaxID=2609290 RepID=UPI0039A100EF
MGDALEGVSDALDDVARAAQQDGQRVETAIDGAGDAATGMGREVEKAGERVERTFRDMVTDAKKADKAVEAVGDNGSKNLDRVKEGAQELQSEFGSNLSEAVSSFRGDLSDLGQTGQDTLGGLAGTVASMGPAGLAGAFALAAGAAGLGLFTAGQEEAKEKQDELNAAAAQWADAYISAGGRIVDSAHTVAEIQAIATDPEKYKVAGENARNWGVDTATAMRAMAGDATALATAEQSLKDRTDEANRRLAEQEVQVDANAGAAYDMADSVKAGRESLDELNGVMSEGRQRAQNAADALYDYATSAGTATEETDDLGNKIYELPDGKKIVVDAKTQRAYEDIDALERQQVSNKTFSVEVDDAAARRKVDALKARIREGVTIPVGAMSTRGGVTWF